MCFQLYSIPTKIKTCQEQNASHYSTLVLTHLRQSQCESFKDYLMVRHTLVAIGPEKGSCYCQDCVAGKPIVQVAGSPPQQYSLPLGWCRFVHRLSTSQ
jgi:hypothetical protein